MGSEMCIRDRCQTDFLLDFNDLFREKSIFSGKMSIVSLKKLVSAKIARSSDFFMELKNRIVVLHFGYFWAYKYFQGRF